MRADAVHWAVAFRNETAVFDGERDGEKLFAIRDFRCQTVGSAHEKTRLGQQLFALLQLFFCEIDFELIHVNQRLPLTAGQTSRKLQFRQLYSFGLQGKSSSSATLFATSFSLAFMACADVRI